VQTDQAGATTGAGIAALQATPTTPPSDVFLIAPRGTVDAGAAGIRVSGNFSVAALQVLNTANIQVQGTTTGITTVQAPNTGALTTASNATAATQQATLPASSNSGSDRLSIIIVEVLGYGGDSGAEQPDNDQRRGRGKQSSNSYDSNNMIRLLGNGSFTEEDTKQLTVMERDTLTSRVVAPSAP
jgi:hypothetical protein